MFETCLVYGHGGLQTQIIPEMALSHTEGHQLGFPSCK